MTPLLLPPLLRGPLLAPNPPLPDPLLAPPVEPDSQLPPGGSGCGLRQLPPPVDCVLHAAVTNAHAKTQLAKR
jgi:hypothetical protein